MKQRIRGYISDIRKYSYSYWLLNTIQVCEKLAFIVIWLQIPIYIAQKDIEGGLHWEQTTKGWIILWWVMIQRIPPLFTGGLSDKYGYKKTLFLSFIFMASGYLMMGTFREFLPFFGGVTLLGFGSGIFLPALQGMVSHNLENKNDSLGWSIHFLLLNLAGFAGAFLSKYLKTISWDTVFYGSAVIILFNFIFLLFVPSIKHTGTSVQKASEIIRNIFRILIEKRLLWFVLIMSGFSIVYLQFYKEFPNFIYDWVDSSALVSSLSLPDYMTISLPRGKMVSYEMMINLNSLLFIFGVIFVSWLFAGRNKLKALIIGITASSVGLMLLGISNFGYITIIGIFIYTFGEMITNPKFNEYLGSIAPPNEKALYMSYLNISYAVGFGGGGILGAFLYQNMAEKASLAKDFLIENFGYSPDDIPLTRAMEMLQDKISMNAADATQLLWDTYHPWLIWIPIVAIGLASAAGLYFYMKSLGKNQ